MEYEPEGFFEQAGDALGIPLGQVAEDLNRFRACMENGGSQTGAWRGQTERSETPNSAEHAMKEGDAASVGESAEGKVLSQDRDIPPKAIVTKAIASGMGEIGSDRIGARGDEPRLTQEHGTVIADTPRPEAIEGSSVEDNLEIHPGSVNVLAPTHERIARRAYELYLERGKSRATRARIG
jgi:hypothetical protein